jgi:RHH-type proline utilization regulon transcriptional repressor/proline dehydrogenase/delta 1-pyrroline-5-carboxylate dehydrogenase
MRRAKLMGDREREARIRSFGKQLLDTARDRAEHLPLWERWEESLLELVMEDEGFRIQALRFLDVLPALNEDDDLVRHLSEYFDLPGLPLPAPLRFILRHVNNGVAAIFIAPLVRRAVATLSRRFIGGDSMAEALACGRRLAERGIDVSLDLLGEATVSERDAERYASAYSKLMVEAPKRIGKWPETASSVVASRPRLAISLKLSSLYSQFNPLDPQRTIAAVSARLTPLLLAARQAHVAVTVDMEHYDSRDVIIACCKAVLLEPGLRDWPHVGLAVQGYQCDAEARCQELIAYARERGTPLTIRLVRGAYWDYETVTADQNGWPCPVWRTKGETDLSYERCMRLLFEAYPDVDVAIASHNLRTQAMAMVLADELGLGQGDFEFQMLYGMAHAIEDILPELGYRLRIYLPFGEIIPGMSYLVRRLLENASSQSFQRMSLSRHLPEDLLLATPDPRRPEPGALPDKAAAAAAASGGEGPPFVNEPLHRFITGEERDRFAAAIQTTRQGLGKYYPLRIAGRDVETAGLLHSQNPALPSERIGTVHTAGIAEADQAVAAGARAFPAWSALPMGERAACLQRAAGLLRERRDEFAALEILEAGKIWREADANVTETIDFLEFYAHEALRLAVPDTRHVPGESNIHAHRPRGVGVVVAPWNFPAAILTGMAAAALVTGNTVIVKPSSQTPVIAARLTDILIEAGIPEGVVQCLPGEGGQIGEYLVAHPGVHFVSFTGSRAVGTRLCQLANLCGGGHHMKHVIAEMGGKNAIVVDSDADLDDAIVGIVQSAFGYQGQKCSACSRVVVVGRHYDALVRRLVEATASLSIGLPEEPHVQLGPVIEQSAREHIEAIIAQGKRTATAVLAMDPGPGPGAGWEGWFVGPAIFTNVALDSPLAQEEIFGPVLAIFRARDFDQAIQIANATDYALTGGLYSRSPSHIRKAARHLAVGNLYINRGITGAKVDRQPFGGYKMSGLGTKSGGREYLLQYMLPVCITENTLRRGFAPSVGGAGRFHGGPY